jgi:hypothetical protein
MTSRKSAIWLSVVVLAGVSAAEADSPPYLVLRAPPLTPDAQHAGHRRPSAQIVPLEASPYAYGWFGARPGWHWSRHFGYYRNYTEWSAR